MGVQLAGPITISMFVVNVAFGILAKAMPQLNILALSFAITIFVGLFVTWIGMDEFGLGAKEIFAQGIEWMTGIRKMLGTG
jgi:flagellar biosynthesis protein FliR